MASRVRGAIFCVVFECGASFLVPFYGVKTESERGAHRCGWLLFFCLFFFVWFFFSQRSKVLCLVWEISQVRGFFCLVALVRFLLQF